MITTGLIILLVMFFADSSKDKAKEEEGRKEQARLDKIFN